MRKSSRILDGFRFSRYDVETGLEEIRCNPGEGHKLFPPSSNQMDLLTEHGRRLRIWSAEISPGGADDVIEVALRQVLRVARVVQLKP